MTLNTARKTEAAFVWAMYILLLPVSLTAVLLVLAKKPLDWILGERDLAAFKVGNRLMHMSDAVKDGKIKNPQCLRSCTAREAWVLLKEEEEGKEAGT